MESLKLENLLKINCKDKTAIIHVSPYDIIEQITFETVFKFVGEIKLFLLQNVEDHDACIGLLMDKNIYIPAIIICFQDLNIFFVFLTSSTLVDNVNGLTVKWILSIDIKPQGTSFCLKESLILSSGKEVVLWINKYFMEKQKVNSLKNIFCTVQTSGSTGENKMVHVPYACIETNVKSLNKHFGITDNDIIYWGTPLTFDPTLVELILGISNGATLLIVPKSVALSPTLLYQALFKNSSTTFLQVVPSVFLRWSKQQISDILLQSTLKILAFGGEPFPLEILKYKRHQNVRLFNLYGVTELSCWATVADLTTYSSINKEVPLGLSLDDTFVQIKNHSGEIILNGIGEICIGSDVRHCFLNDNDQSISPFLVETGDLGEWEKGNLYYRGRKTRIIKRYGHRLVLHKIENTIFLETGLQSRLVYCSDDKKLLAFILIEENFSKSTRLKLLDKLKVKLLKILPEYGFPDFLDVLTRFPLNRHGKICDKILTKRYKDTLIEHPSKQNPDEVFNEVLSDFLKTEFLDPIDQIGKYTFFELGGNSILAIQVLKAFEERVRIESSGDLATLLFNDNIHACLNYVRQNIKSKRKLIDCDAEETKSLKIDMDQHFVEWTYDLKGCVDCAPVCFQIW